NKVLTANPDLAGDTLKFGIYQVAGFARGVATMKKSDGGVMAYTAVQEVGLMAADVGFNTPERKPFAGPQPQYTPETRREKEAIYPGDYYDVLAFGGRLFAAEKTNSTIDVFDSSLSLLSSTPLGNLEPRKIAYVENFQWDRDGNGRITPDEVLNLAFVGGK